ncbi:hypothetical protein [Streptomyces griseus]|uniref:hypothetical protein n=1 Tax=Streptomyces griseus TaxID=1911 RepID=UPI0033E1652B
MLVWEEIRLAGGEWNTARSESHLTRSAVTAPVLQVRLLLPELGEVAQLAAQPAYDMRAVDGTAALQGGARERAIGAADGLVAAAGVALAGIGAARPTVPPYR